MTNLRSANVRFPERTSAFGIDAPEGGPTVFGQSLAAMRSAYVCFRPIPAISESAFDHSRPGRCVLWETLAPYADNAESLAGRCAHNDPILKALLDCRTKLFEPCDFSGDVVGLDVDVNATFVVDTLDLDADLIRL
jgi:hypothetical protein